MLLLLTLPAVAQAQFTHTTNDGTITITFLRYFGARDAVDRAIARGGTDPDLLVRDVARSMKFERTK